MKKSLGTKIMICILVLDFIFIGGIATVGINFSKAAKASEEISETYLMVVKDFGDANTNMQALIKRHFIISALMDYLDDETLDAIASVGIGESDSLVAAMDDLEIRVKKINSSTFTEEFQQLSDGAHLVADGYKNTMYEMYKARNMTDANDFYNNTLQEPMLAHDTNLALMNEELNNLIEQSKADLAKANNGVRISLVIGVVLFAIATVLSAVLINRYIAPLKKAKNELDLLLTDFNNGNADLSERIATNSQDEVGALVGGINSFLATLQNVIFKISNESGNIHTSVETTSAIVDSSKNDISNVSSVMEEISASMDTTNDFINSITVQADTVNNAVSDVAQQVDAGSEKVQSIKNNAVSIRKDTEERKNSTYQMVSSIQDTLEASIAESKNVEQIQTLTEDILSIASQTNLLALNASIEAARAGEAGKGFAVVADEIRQLADHSRETANSIQDISSQVVSAVGSLASNSNDMLVYVSDTVLKDYDGFLDVANVYANDADELNEVFSRVNENTSNLNDALQQMTSDIVQISGVIGECTRGVSDATCSTSELLKSITDIQADSANNMDISQRLQDEVSRFSGV